MQKECKITICPWNLLRRIAYPVYLQGFEHSVCLFRTSSATREATKLGDVAKAATKVELERLATESMYESMRKDDHAWRAFFQSTSVPHETALRYLDALLRIVRRSRIVLPHPALSNSRPYEFLFSFPISPPSILLSRRVLRHIESCVISSLASYRVLRHIESCALHYSASLLCPCNSDNKL